ncbi:MULTISPECIES: hypothetical protein [unclassified Sphingobium]|uniref:hypothetical protein n=1 Tax=unclassified Sphingobium TaxID=2611147 RepID=UPI002224FF03|nr:MULTISPECIES: hypothetical protein [unclassified Sphingobium]MCW2349887.1 hypothetical protein [Sphingobium sp. B12D2B]MCW2368988.1 hypothetical protein [Sphingobium sp. B11D3D]
MQTPAPAPSSDDPSKDPIPLPVRQTSWWVWITPALSIAILAVVIWQFRSFRLDDLLQTIPANPLFWVAFFGYYFTGLAFDFIIFRWLWHIPGEGLIALARKNVTNELIVDYLGEAYFYSWARKKIKMEGSPFGAVKDVAILSAVVSNIFTLAMMALVYPYAKSLNLGITSSALAASVGVIMVVSLLVFVFSKRIFSLTRTQLWAISGLHFARLLVGNVLLAVVWSLALPDVALGWWLVLATVRMLLSRLPLISNKDIIFAAVAVFAVGQDSEIHILIALITTLILLTHLVIGAVLAIGDLATIRVGRKEKPA